MNKFNERKIMINVIMKKTIKLIGNLLWENQFIFVVTEGKINRENFKSRPHKSIFEENF